MAAKYRCYLLDHAASAKAAQLGIWSGTFQMPWEWRKAN
jgi:endonuclease YncB( thermonuclease family)